MVCFVVTQHSEASSHSVFATPKHLAFRLLKKFISQNCYLLSVICNAKNSFMETVKLSTVTLGDGVIDLSCDMMKNKAQKIWNISLLFVYLQRK